MRGALASAPLLAVPLLLAGALASSAMGQTGASVVSSALEPAQIAVGDRARLSIEV